MRHTNTEPGKAPAVAPSWRDVIKVHPAADLFPLMSPDELKELGEDIKRHGMELAIILWVAEDGDYLLDGRNRLDAMEAVGLAVIRDDGDLSWTIPTREINSTDICDPYDLVLTVNAHRRHLTAEQKREIVAKVLMAQPGKSNRRIAQQVKVDHKTVGAVRAKLEAGGEIPHHDLREDARGTKQPATKRQPDHPWADPLKNPIGAAWEKSDADQQRAFVSLYAIALKRILAELKPPGHNPAATTARDDLTIPDFLRRTAAAP